MRKKRTGNARNTASPAAPVTYLAESEVARRLGIDENTLHQWALTWTSVSAKPQNELASRLEKARRRVQLLGAGQRTAL